MSKVSVAFVGVQGIELKAMLLDGSAVPVKGVVVVGEPKVVGAALKNARITLKKQVEPVKNS